MKYYKTLLVLPLIAAMTAAGALSAAPAADKKADPAAEKAKADAEKRNQAPKPPPKATGTKSTRP